MDIGAGTHTENHDYKRTETAADGKPGTPTENAGGAPTKGAVCWDVHAE